MKMLCCHDSVGRISNVIFEPIPESFVEHYDKIGLLHVMFDNPDNLSALAVASLHYVSVGQITMRPDCPAVVTVEGRAINFADVPADGTVVAVLDKGTEFERRESVSDKSMELDEAGAVHILVDSPWPYLQGVYDVDVE